jgi:heme/copper-type cytochrome/quinol oxidase subunit 2
MTIKHIKKALATIALTLLASAVSAQEIGQTADKLKEKLMNFSNIVLGILFILGIVRLVYCLFMIRFKQYPDGWVRKAVIAGIGIGILIVIKIVIFTLSQNSTAVN